MTAGVTGNSMTSLSSIPNIVPILSGKGGVGKSSVTVQLALSLCLAGYNVGVLDIDLTGPSIPRLFGIEDEKVRQAPGGWLPVMVHPSFASSSSSTSTASNGGGGGGAATRTPSVAAGGEGEIIHGVQEGNEGGQDRAKRGGDKIGALNVMSLGFLLRNRGDAVIWRGPKKTAMVTQLLSDTLWPSSTEYLLVDTPPGTSDEHISLITTLLDPTRIRLGTTTTLASVLVTTPQAVSTSDVKKELSFCSKVGLSVIGVIENMAGYVCPCCGEITNVFSKGGGEVMARDWQVAFLGSVPLDAGDGWGGLIESGRRPGVENDEAAKEGKMVEKYTSCALCPIFAKITKHVMLAMQEKSAKLPIPPSTSATTVDTTKSNSAIAQETNSNA